MNNLKKTVAVILAVAMVLTMGIATSFAAFTDVPSTKSYAEAVNILNNLGIINGYEDGTFKPDNTITRAEVATIITNTFGLSPINGATVFSDVPADHWAAGYINAAYSAGIIAGMGDGTFAPGADVTYEQVVKMIVAGLNYGLVADGQGGYPTGYLAVASSNGITSGAAGTVGQAATRATVAKLVYNSLEVGMLTSNAYTTTGEITYVVDDSKTILANLGVEKLEVVVEGSYLTNDTYDAKNRKVTLVANKRYNSDDYPNSNYITDDVAKGGYFEVADFDEGGTAAASLLGYACVAYVGVDEDTDVDTIFAISAKGSKNTVTTVKGTMFDAESATSDSKIYYRNNNKTYKLTPDEDVKTYVNYEDTTDANEGINRDSVTADYEEALSNGGVVDFIDNDGDGDFDFVIANIYTAEAVIESIEEDDGVWTFDTYTGDLDEYDPEDEDILKLFIKGENYIDVTELAEGDTVTTIAKGNDANGADVILYYVSSEKIEGSATAYDPDDETFTIGGKSGIGMSPIAADVNYSSVVNKQGTFYLNSDGLISYVDGSASVGGNYGYVTGIDDVSSFSTNYEVQIVDVQGNANVYTFPSKLSVYYSDGSKTTLRTKDDMYNFFEKEVLNDFSTRLIKYTTSGSTISKVVVAGYDDDFELNQLSSTKTYDAEDLTIGGATFTTSTVVFNLDGSATDVEDMQEADNISVGSVSKFFSDGATYGGDLYYYGDPDSVAVVLAANLSTAIDESENVFVVSSTSVTYIDGENAVVVKGYKGGSSFSFTLYNEDDPGVADMYVDNGVCSLARGTVLMIGDVANGSYITDLDDIREIVTFGISGNRISTLPQLSETEAEEYDFRGDHIVQGIVGIDVASTRDQTSNDRIVFEGWMGDYDYYRPNSSTIITLVDLTSGTKLSDISVTSKKAASALRFTTAYAGCAYIRLYDTSATYDTMDLQANRGDVVDIVAYKFTTSTYESLQDVNDSVITSGFVGTVVDDEDEGEIIEAIDDEAEVEEEIESEVEDEAEVEEDVEEVTFEIL